MEGKSLEGKRTFKEKVNLVEEDVDDDLDEEVGGSEMTSFVDNERKKTVTVGSGKKASSPGAGGVSTPSCQAEKCGADLTDAKRYHRRHKVCEFHSKASAVIVAGQRQRFCQQCSRYGIPIFVSFSIVSKMGFFFGTVVLDGQIRCFSHEIINCTDWRNF